MEFHLTAEDLRTSLATVRRQLKELLEITWRRRLPRSVKSSKTSAFYSRKIAITSHSYTDYTLT